MHLPLSLITCTTRHASPTPFMDMFAVAKVGDTFTYAEGNLMFSLYYGRRKRAYSELKALKQMALDLADRKRACLTQKRVGEDQWEYRITKRG